MYQPVFTSYVAMCEIHGMHHPEIRSNYAREQLFVSSKYDYEWRMKTSCMLGVLDKEKS